MIERTKTNLELKREYWTKFVENNPHMGIDVEWMVLEYGSEPATSGEAFYILRVRIVDLLKVLPIIGRLWR